MSCTTDLSNPTNDTTNATTNTKLWINAVYNQGWKKLFLGLPSNEDFPFESNGNFILDFNPSKFSPTTFKTQVNTQFILDEVLGDASGAYYRLIYTLDGENIELYALIGYSKFKHQILIYLPNGDAKAPPSDATTQVKKAWLEEKYVACYFSSLGETIALKN